MQPKGGHAFQYESVNNRFVPAPVQDAHCVFASRTDDANKTRVFKRVSLSGSYPFRSNVG